MNSCEKTLLYRNLMAGDLLCTLPLHDLLEETGDKMLHFEVGKNYWCHTGIWGYVFEVLGASEFEVFCRGSQIHDWGDFPLAVVTGKFTANREISPIGEFEIPMWQIVVKGPWRHPVPMERTHPPME